MDQYILIALIVLILAAIVMVVRRGKSSPSVNKTPKAIQNRLYRTGCDLIKPYILLHGTRSRPASSRRGARDLRQGIEHLKTVVQVNPDNWSAFWVMGKAYQALGESRSAYESFSQAYSLQNQNADVAREVVFACLNLGRGKEAVELAKEAIRLGPDDSGMKANLALALLIDAQTDQALEVAREASRADLNDPITRNILNIIEEVKSGKRTPPRHYGDISGAEQ